MTGKTIFYLFCLLIQLTFMLTERERKWYIKLCGVCAVITAIIFGRSL